MRYSSLSFLFFVLICFVSCRKENSEKVNQDDIWTDYKVIYSSELDTTFARVSFKHKDKNGESLKLSSKSEILINEINPDFNGIFQWYQLMIKGEQSPILFEYEDLEGNVFSNSIEVSGVAEINVNLDTIYSDSVFYLPWNGLELKDGEFVNAIFDGALDNDLTVITQDSINTNGIYIKSTSLNKLPLGDLTVHFERWNEIEVFSTSAGGQGFGRYISKKKTIKLVD